MQQSLYVEFGRLNILELYYFRTICCLLSHVVWLIMLSWQKEFAQLLCDWMDLENVVLSELSKTETENHHMTSFISRIQKEMIQ